MKISRQIVKNALNYCKKNELYLKKQKLTESYDYDNNKNSFWKTVNKLNIKNE